MRIIALPLLALVLLTVLAGTAYAQSRKVESITIPYTAANAERTHPEHYFFPSTHVANWIVEIRNELVYDPDNADAKVVLRLKEKPEDIRFVEIAMLAEPSRAFHLAFVNEQVGYMQLTGTEDSWLSDRAVMVSFIENDRLSVNSGQRNVMDRLRIGPFDLNAVEVYGKDTADSADNAIGGELILDIVSGDPLENPVMMVPLILLAAVGGTIITLLKVKKRT